MGNINADRGARAKKRSKDWCAKQGYPVCDMEIIRNVFTQDGIIPTKRDQWGSDLCYMDALNVVFLQVKGGGRKLAVLQREAQQAFDSHAFAAHCRLELHVWRPYAKAPEIFECHKTNRLT